MMEIFKKSKKLRSVYKEVPYTDFTGTDEATSVRAIKLEKEARIIRFKNHTDDTIYIQLQSPEDDSDKLDFVPIRSGASFYLDSLTGLLHFIPAKTTIYIHTDGQPLTEGHFRIFSWG